MPTALEKIQRAAAGPAPQADPAADLVAAAASCLEDLVVLLAWDPDNDGDDDSSPSGDTDHDYAGKGKGKPKGKAGDDEDEDDDEEAARKKKLAARKKSQKVQAAALAAGARIALAGLAGAGPDRNWVEMTAGPAGPQVLMLAGPDSDAGKAKPYGNVPYGDPGYQADGKARYPLDEKHIHAALSYFSKPKNQEPYTPAQVKSIWGRIKSAASKLGVKVDSDIVTASVLLELAAPADGGLAMHHGPFTGTHNHAHVGSVVHSHSHLHNNDSQHACGPAGMHSW
jgi:hypothetical protein